MDPVTKTYVSFGLVILAVFEFWMAMQVFGRKKPIGKAAKTVMRLHRIGGYVFFAYFIWISWVCVDLMSRIADAGALIDSRAVIHGSLAIALILIFLLKLCFVRLFQKYRQYAQLLGMFLATGTVLLWGIAGWMFLIII